MTNNLSAIQIKSQTVAYMEWISNCYELVWHISITATFKTLSCDYFCRNISTEFDDKTTFHALSISTWPSSIASLETQKFITQHGRWPLLIASTWETVDSVIAFVILPLFPFTGLHIYALSIDSSGIEFVLGNINIFASPYVVHILMALAIEKNVFLGRWRAVYSA